MPTLLATRPSPGQSRRTPAAVAAIALAAVLVLSGCITPAQADAHQRVNDTRARSGIHELAYDEQAELKAQAWAERLASRNQLAHSRLRDGMSGWKLIGENVGYGSSVESVHRQFMASAPHRANIVDRRFTHLGTGVATGHGRTWVVHVFVQR